MKQQQTLMKFDPAFGTERPYPSHAQQYRDYHGARAWLFNPWTGEARDAYDIGSDKFGLLIVPPGEPVYAHGESMAENRAELLAEDIECLHMALDKAGVPRKANGGLEYSMWGRVLRFKEMPSNGEVRGGGEGR